MVWGGSGGSDGGEGEGVGGESGQRRMRICESRFEVDNAVHVVVGCCIQERKDLAMKLFIVLPMSFLALACTQNQSGPEGSEHAKGSNAMQHAIIRADQVQWKDAP